jgi:hypothetical protein
MLSFLNRRHLSSGAVIVCISCAVFLLRLYACRYIYPLYTGMDYYGYLELAKNIVHHLDFTVRWELDQPLRYPPFFALMAYVLTCLTKNFMTSIQLISVFSASFLLIPLFFLVRNILNVTSASFAVLFAIYYFGIKPCYMPNMDFFFSFLNIIICWLIWDTLTLHSRQAGRYVLAGVLVSMAYLTKFSGVVFGVAAIASILYYFVRSQGDFRRGLKMSVWLLLGAAPLVTTYQLLLNHNSPKQSPSIAAYAFFDGNYQFEKGWYYREEKMSELNAAGTEFGHIDLIKSGNEFDFLLREPLFVFDKYLWGLDKITQEMTFSVFPGGYIPNSRFTQIGPNGNTVFHHLMDDGWSGILREASSKEVVVNPYYDLTKESVRNKAGHDFDKVWKILDRFRSLRKMINFLFQGAFLVLLVLSGFYYRWHFHLMHILFFTFGMVLVPFYLIQERYLTPFMPLYFVLWLFILNAGFSVIKKEITDKTFLRNVVLTAFASFLLMYSADTYKQTEHFVRVSRVAGIRKGEWSQVASWIKKDFRHPSKRMKIMACGNNYISYLTDSDYIRLPYMIYDWNQVLNFAALKKVDYIVVDWYNLYKFLTFSQDEFKKPLNPQALLNAIKAAMPPQAAIEYMDRAGVSPAAPPLESLNKLAEYRDLYQVMPLRPAGSIKFIEQLKAGRDYELMDLKETNRLLMELNYPKESPHKLLLNETNPVPIKMVHEIKGDRNSYWIYRL